MVKIPDTQCFFEEARDTTVIFWRWRGSVQEEHDSLDIVSIRRLFLLVMIRICFLLIVMIQFEEKFLTLMIRLSFRSGTKVCWNVYETFFNCRVCAGRRLGHAGTRPVCMETIVGRRAIRKSMQDLRQGRRWVRLPSWIYVSVSLCARIVIFGNCYLCSDYSPPYDPSQKCKILDRREDESLFIFVSRNVCVLSWSASQMTNKNWADVVLPRLLR